jgi:hypothetical protein
MKYKITIQKITPRENEDMFNRPRFFNSEVVFDAELSENEVITLMRVGYELKESYIKEQNKK